MFGANKTGFGGGGGFGATNNSTTGGFGAPSTPFGGGNQANNTSGFGGGGGFGSTNTGFGSGTNTGGFGSATPASGGFGASSTGFGGASTGGFGSNNNNNNNSNVFGANRAPQTGGGLFGNNTNTGGFGGTPAQPASFGNLNNTNQSGNLGKFGAPSSGGFGFGASNSNTGGFGASSNTGGSLFGGQANQNTSFGASPATSTGFGASQAPSIGGFGGAGMGGGSSGTLDPKYQPTNVSDSTTGVQCRQMAITTMPQYQGKSFEELRFEDYQQGRKGGAAAAGGAAGGMFGGSSGFGTSGATTGGFGSTSTSSGFGASTGGFGSAAPATGGGFGSSSGGFGTTPASTGFGGAQPSTPFGGGAATTGGGFGGFGTAASSAGQTGGFGSTSTATPGVGGFGAAKPQSGFGFGATTSTPASSGAGGFGSFGAPTSSAPAVSSGFGGFGATATSSAPAMSFGSAPGATTTPAFGTGSSFGGASTGGFSGGLGQNNASKGFGFGTAPAASAAPATSFGAATSGGFGLGGASAAKPSFSVGGFGGLGGSSAASTAPALGGTTSSFSFNSGSGLGAATPALSLGGAKPSGGFGLSTPQTGLGSFGQPSTGGFSSGLAGGFAGAPNAATPAKVASLGQSPYGNSPLFASPAPGAQQAQPDISSSPVTSDNEKHSSGGIPAHYKATPKSITRVKPRGYGKLQKVHLFDGTTDDAALSPDKFVPRQSVKYLVIKNTPGNDKTSSQSRTIGERNSFLATEEDFVPDDSVIGPSGSPYTPDKRSSDQGILDQGSSSRLNLTGSTPANRSNDILNSSSSANQSMELARPFARRGISDDGGDKFGGASILKGSTQSASLVPSLCREDYFCKPTIEELKGLDEEGLSKVENFEIGRDGVGSVMFPGVTDVRQLNLDEIVFFEPKEISLYPIESEKPEVGKGLNKRAQVRLCKIFPTDKRTRETISDPDHLRKRKYDLKLKKMCSKMGSKHISFDFEEGTWVFEVEHFSKYGLLDDDDDDEEMEDAVGEEKANLLPKGSALSSTKNLDVQDSQMSSRGADKGKTPLFASGDGHGALPPTQATPWTMEKSALNEPAADLVKQLKDTHAKQRLPEKLQLNAEKMQVMRKYLFQPEDSSMVDVERQHGSSFENSENLANPTPQKEAQPSSFSPSSVLIRGSSSGIARAHWVDASSEPKEQPSKKFLVNSPVLRSTIVSRKSPSIMETRSQDPVNENTCIMKKKTELMADHGLFMGRSFRVSWGPDGSLVRLGSLPSCVKGKGAPASMMKSEPKSSKQCINISKLDVCSSDNDCETVKSLLSAQLDGSEILDKGENPRIEMNEKHRAFAILENLLSSIHEDKVDSVDKKTMLSSWTLRLKLIKVLWKVDGAASLEVDEMQGTHTSSLVEPTYKERMFRRREFTEWIMEVISDELAEEIDLNCMDDDKIQEVFTLLSGNRVQKACEVAKRNRDYRLALLVSQTGNPQVRDYVSEQLEKWNSLDASDFIDEARMDVYKLISGDITSVCGHVGWVRALGMFLWFKCSPSESIVDAFGRYTDAMKEGYCAKPLPWYVSDNGGSSSDFFDMSYHLISLFCDRSHSLAELCNTWTACDNDLDYCLSWHVFSILIGIGFNHLSDLKGESLTMSYASQLENLGVWEWSIFVILHHTDDSEREHAIRDILYRNICLDPSRSYQVKEEFVLERLYINPSWIYLAKARRAFAEKKWEIQAQYLCKGGEWNACHDVVVGQLVANALIDENYEIVKDLLDELNTHKKSIKNWDNNGAIYKDYISICSAFNDFSNNSSSINNSLLQSLEDGINSLSRRVSKLPLLSVKHRFCQAEMATKLVFLLKAVRGYFDKDFSDHKLSSALRTLPLPNDYMFSQLSVVVDSYAKFVESN
eukprot:Nk52_evm60s1444 gene=Nk52_evmTU60s1444